MSDTVADRPRLGAVERVAEPGPAEMTSARHDIDLACQSVGSSVFASATLLIEKIEDLENPDYVPSCSINPVLSCGSIMRTSQARSSASRT